MIAKEITREFTEGEITRKIQVNKVVVILTTIRKDKDSKCYKSVYTYQYGMYEMFNNNILTIVTYKGETIVFNLNRCSVIANIPKLVKIECTEVVDQTFVKVVDGKKQSIYDERSNLLETSNKFDMEVIFNGCRPAIKMTDWKTNKSHYIEL